MTDEEAGPVRGHPSHPMKYGPALSCDETQVYRIQQTFFLSR